MSRVRTLQRRPHNAAEASCWDELIKGEWEPWKRGWPDFMAFKGDRLICVEVKPHSSVPLKAAQERILRALAAHGIQCFRWSPDGGFEPVRAPVRRVNATS